MINHDDQERAEFRILERLARDRAAPGGLRNLAHYQAEFPRHAELVQACYATQQSNQHFARFEITRPLGRGGQGRVFCAHDSANGNDIALKILPPTIAPSGTEPAALLRELEAVARVDHPAIARVLDSGIEDSRPWLAMQLIDGPTLDTVIDGWRRGEADNLPSDRDRIDIVRQLADALAAAHAVDVLHRDVKPSNVVMRDGVEPVLIDFGLARAVDSELPSLTHTGDVLGTPEYLAPERLTGLGRDDPRTDVWSLGIVLFEVLTLATPFGGATIESVARSIERDEVPSVRRHLRSQNGSIAARALDAVLATALAKSPTQRYRTASRFATDLKRLLAGDPVEGRRPSVVTRAARWSRRNAAAASLLIVLLVGAVVAAAAAVQFRNQANAERRASLDATAGRAMASAESADVVLASSRAGRNENALALIEQANELRQRVLDAAADGEVATRDLPQLAELRSTAAAALIAWDLTPRDTLPVGGLGSAIAAADGSAVAFVGLAPGVHKPAIRLVDAHTGGVSVRFSDAVANEYRGLCAIAPRAAALAAWDSRTSTLRIARLDAAAEITSTSEISVPIRRRPGVNPRRRSRAEAWFDHGGRLLVCAFEDDEGGAWRCFDVSNGEMRFASSWTRAVPAWCGISADGQWIAGPDSHIRGTILVSGFSASSSFEWKLELDHDEHIVAGYPFDDAIAVITVGSGIARLRWAGPSAAEHAPQQLVVGNTTGLGRITVSHDGRLLAAAVSDAVVLYDLEDRSVARAFSAPSAGAAELLAFTADGSLLYQRRGARVRRFEPLRRVALFGERQHRAAPKPPAAVVNFGARGAPRDFYAKRFMNAATDDPLQFETSGTPLAVDANAPTTPGPRAAARLIWFDEHELRAALVAFERNSGRVLLEAPLDGNGRGGVVALDQAGNTLIEVTSLGTFTAYDIASRSIVLRIDDIGIRPVAARFLDDGDIEIWSSPDTVRRLRFAALRAELESRKLGW